MGAKREIRHLHLKLAEDRGREKTFCPSEVARLFAPTDWQIKMDEVRKLADALVESGNLVVLQKGKVIRQRPSETKGPIRLRKGNDR
jgi:hypothetical protein